MRTLDQLKVERAKTQRVEIRIGDYLNDSFSIFSKHWQQFCLFALVSMLISIVSILTIVGPYLVMYPLQMGYGHVVDKIEKGENFEFNEFFIGFNTWTKYIPFLLILFFSSLLIFIPFIVFMGGFGALVDYNQDFAPIFGLSILIVMPIMVVLFFVLCMILFLVPYLIYYSNLSTIACIKISYQIMKKNFWYLLLFVILFSIISQIGTYACLIGVFASMPIGYIMVYLMVKDMLLTDGQNEIDMLGQSQDL